MFGPQLSVADEQLMNMLRHFAHVGSKLDGLQAELWRRNISQSQYLDWLKKENESKKE